VNKLRFIIVVAVVISHPQTSGVMSEFNVLIITNC